MSEVPQRKLTQFTLASFIKPKATVEDVTKSPECLSNLSNKSQVTKKRSSSSQGGVELKKTKYSSPHKPDDVLSSDDPEVSSSSECTKSCTSQQKSVRNLDAYVKLIRVDTPKVEVTSSTTDDSPCAPKTAADNSPCAPKTAADNNPCSPKTAADATSCLPKSTTDGSPCAPKPSADDENHAFKASEASPDLGLITVDQTKNIESHPFEVADIVSSESESNDLECSLMDISVTVVSPTQTPKSAIKRKRPVSAKKKEEQEKIQEEKRQQKLLKEKAKREEKERKEREQEEQKRQRDLIKEAKMKEKEEKQKQKDELKAKKQQEIEAKNAIKEAEKKKKEEERMQKEQEKHKAEEEKLKKQEAQKKLLNYFCPASKKESRESVGCDQTVTGRWNKPFPVSSELRLAPIYRRVPIHHDDLDERMKLQDGCHMPYLKVVKAGGRVYPRTWRWDEDSSVQTSYKKSKLFQFHTDIRPAYFGTWRKSSKSIKPRRPFGKDPTYDYEVDSADEWEEEEPGESLSSDDDEDEEKDEFDFDPELREEGFLVDHNYLSDDEGAVSDDEDTLAAKKTKQLIARTYGKKNRKKSRLRPSVYCTLWSNCEEEDTDHHKKVLDTYKAILFEKEPIKFVVAEVDEDVNIEASHSAKKSSPKFPDEAMPDLIKITHGSRTKWTLILKSFQEICTAKSPPIEIPSKRLLRHTLQNIAKYLKKDVNSKPCWYVHDDILLKYDLTDLPLPNPISTASKPDPAISKIHDSPKGTPHSANSKAAQKSLTDFVKKRSKKPVKLFDSQPNIDKKLPEVVMLTDSPDVHKTSRATNNITVKSLSTTPEKESKARVIEGTPVSSKRPVTKLDSPQRVVFTTLSPALHNEVNQEVQKLPTSSPSTLITENHNSPSCSSNSSNVETKVVPSRRVALTAVSNLAPNNQTAPVTPSKVDSIPAHSPRRVSFVTLSSPSQNPENKEEAKPRRIALTSIPLNSSLPTKQNREEGVKGSI